MRLGLACAVLVTLSGCELFYPLDDAAAPHDTHGVSLRQQADGQGSGVTETLVSFSSPPGSGNTLVLVAAGTSKPATAVSGISAWRELTVSSVHFGLTIWTTVVPAGASGPVKVTWPETQTTTLVHLSEWTGLAAPGPSLTAGGTATDIRTETLTFAPSDRVGLVFAAAVGHVETGITIGPPPATFTALPTLSRDLMQLVLAYTVAPPSGSYAVTWGDATKQSWEAHIASFTRPQ